VDYSILAAFAIALVLLVAIVVMGGWLADQEPPP
jgi:hypothetical protein